MAFSAREFLEVPRFDDLAEVLPVRHPAKLCLNRLPLAALGSRYTVLEMKEQPQFEARVGESDPDPVLPRQTEGGVDLLRCVLVPVEDHPKLSPHGFGARAQADCGCYGRVRLVTVVTLSPRVLRSELNGEAQLCCIPVVQPVKIRPLGLPFADGEQDLLPSSNVRGPAPERSAS
jgi:hypothetical protein